MKTTSEGLFEQFLTENGLLFEKIAVAATPRPDYLVNAGEFEIVFELKELTEDQNFKIPMGVDRSPLSKRIVGDHVRRAIDGAKKQIQHGAKELGIPSILLIYNKIGPLFGTDDHDFTTAMYGEFTILLNSGTGAMESDVFHGRNARLREKINTSFSAVGRLASLAGDLEVTLFENIHAQVPIPYEKLPNCFHVKRVQINSSTI
jgi:hypothetical protein